MRRSTIWFAICWGLYPLERLGLRRPYIAAFRRYTHAALHDGAELGRVPQAQVPSWP